MHYSTQRWPSEFSLRWTDGHFAASLSLRLSFCPQFIHSHSSGLGEAVQTLNNVSLLEQLGVKTQCESSEKKHVHALFILLPVSLTCLQRKGKDTLLLLHPADVRCCTPFHIIHPRFSKVVTDFLNEMSVNEWRAFDGRRRRLSGSCVMGCGSWEWNLHADTHLVVMLSYFFPFNEHDMSESDVRLCGCECVRMCDEDCFHMSTKYWKRLHNTGE